MSNICERCGGQIVPLNTNRQPGTVNGVGVSVTTYLSAHSTKLCHCPPEQSKHDGKLGKKMSVTRVVSSQSLWLSINDHEFGKSVGLQPSEALSLLEWLQLERATLEEWAKEQEA